MLTLTYPRAYWSYKKLNGRYTRVVEIWKTQDDIEIIPVRSEKQAWAIAWRFGVTKLIK